MRNLSKFLVMALAAAAWAPVVSAQAPLTAPVTDLRLPGTLPS